MASSCDAAPAPCSTLVAALTIFTLGLLGRWPRARAPTTCRAIAGRASPPRSATTRRPRPPTTPRSTWPFARGTRRGVRVRFVRTTSRKRAQLVIRRDRSLPNGGEDASRRPRLAELGRRGNVPEHGHSRQVGARGHRRARARSCARPRPRRARQHLRGDVRFDLRQLPRRAERLVVALPHLAARRLERRASALRRHHQGTPGDVVRQGAAGGGSGADRGRDFDLAGRTPRG